jgi:HEAT repeat protein
MEQSNVLEVLGQERVPADQISGDAVIQALDAVVQAIMDPRLTSLETAVSLARGLVATEPSLDAPNCAARLIETLLAVAAGDIRKVAPAAALRALAVMEEISDGSRLSPCLLKLQRHPSAHVRSKVALLLGRVRVDLNQIKSLLASGDPRVRANALECLWGLRGPQVLSILQEASEDKHGRVAFNGLVGLCRAGDRNAYGRIEKMAGSADVARRAGAAWAMGELKDPQFATTLGHLMQDPEESVRRMAAKSLDKLPMPADSPGSSGPEC